MFWKEKKIEFTPIIDYKSLEMCLRHLNILYDKHHDKELIVKTVVNLIESVKNQSDNKKPT